MKKEDSHRPWGFYEILADKINHKVKRITVYSNKRLSLQRHKYRDEHWYIIYGNGVVTNDDDKINVSSGISVDIKRGAAHRIENKGAEDLIFIEIQTGEYFGEDDIERLEDDFGRI